MQIWLATVIVSLILNGGINIQFQRYIKNMGCKTTSKKYFTQKFSEMPILESALIFLLASIMCVVWNAIKILVPGFNIGYPLYQIINRDNIFYKDLQEGLEAGYYTEKHQAPEYSVKDSDKYRNYSKPFEIEEVEDYVVEEEFLEKYNKFKKRVEDTDFTDALAIDGANVSEIKRQYKLAKPELKNIKRKEKYNMVDKKANAIFDEIMMNTNIPVEEKTKLLNQLKKVFRNEDRMNMQPINTATILSNQKTKTLR